MKKQLFIVTILFLFFANINAQTGKSTIKAEVKWGAYTDKKTAKKLGVEGENSIIYNGDEGLFSLNTKLGMVVTPFYTSFYKVYTLIKINKSNLTPSLSYQFKKSKIDGLAAELGDVFNIGDEIYATFLVKDNKAKKMYIYSKKIDKKTLIPNEKSTKLVTINFEDDNRLAGFEYEMKKSTDNTKFLIYYSFGKKKENEKIGMNVFDADMNQISEYNETFEYTDKEMEIISEQISTNGDVSIIASIKKDKADILFRIYNFSNGAKTTKYELKIGNGLRITDIQIGYNKTNQLVVAGFYTNAKVVSDIKGSFYGYIDISTGEINRVKYKDFDLKFIKDGLTKREQSKADSKASNGKSLNLTNVRMGDLLFTPSGRTILVGETHYSYTRVITMGNSSRTVVVYVYGNALVLSFNSEGDLEWNQKIQKYTSTQDYRLPITSTCPMMTKGENTYFVYRGDISKTASTTTADKNGSTFMTKFNADGKESVAVLLKKLDVPGWITGFPFAYGSNEVYGMKYVRGSGFAFCKVNIQD